MKRTAVTIAIVAAALAAAGGVLAWHESAERAARERRVLAHVRDEARELVGYCDLESFAAQIDMATSRFPMYVAADRPRAAKTLGSIVMPVIDARELACTSAQSDLEQLRADGEPDPWVDAQLPKVRAAVAVVARTREAARTFARAVADPATPTDDLARAAGAIRDATKP